jgi:hypothetical protein
MDVAITILGGGMIMFSLALSIATQRRNNQLMETLGYTSHALICPEWQDILSGHLDSTSKVPDCLLPALINHKINGLSVEEILETISQDQIGDSD